jgi:hypothetical protein
MTGLQSGARSQRDDSVLLWHRLRNPGSAMHFSNAIVIRRVVGCVCLMLASFLAIVANIGVYAQRDIYDTERFAKHASALLRDPDVREQLAQSMANALVSEVPQLRSVEPLLATAASAVISTPQFAAVFDDAVRQAHSQLVSGARTIQLDLGASVSLVLRQLTEGLPFAQALIPDFTGALKVTVLERSQAPALWSAVEIARNAAYISLIGTVVLLIVGMLVLDLRSLGVLLIGAGALFAGGVAIAGQFAVRQIITGGMLDPVSERAYLAVLREFGGPLRSQSLLVMLVGAIVAAVGVVLLVTRAKAQRAQGSAVYTTRPGVHSGS